MSAASTRKPRIESLINVLIYLLTFYGSCSTVYFASQESKNVNKLVSFNLVETRRFISTLGRWWRYITQDISNNDEWNNLLKFFVYISVSVLYLPVSILSCLLHRRIHQIIRIISSVSILTLLLGRNLSLDVAMITIIFFLVGWLFHGYPIIIWSIGIISLSYSNDFLEETIFQQLHKFDKMTARIVSNGIYSTHFMCLLRAISMALFLCNRPSAREDNQKRETQSNITQTQSTESQPAIWEQFLDALEYAFYLPTMYYGPIVVYADWNSFLNNKTPTKFVRPLGRFRRLTLAQLLGRALRLLCVAAFWSALTCILYPKAILSYPNYLSENPMFGSRNPWFERGLRVQSWTVWSCLNLAGIGFYFFHVLIYGIPGLIADTEQYAIESVQRWWRRSDKLTREAPEEVKRSDEEWNGLSLCLVPAPPSCVFRITLFSEMWRTFDRGLYNFMFCHIYVPLIEDETKPLEQLRWYSKIRFLRKLVASTLPFCFVLLFHTVNYQNAIWILVNMAQFYVERLIRWADTNTRIGLKLREPAWVSWRHRLLAILHSLSTMSSLLGLVFFLFGYTVGMAFIKHVMFSYGSLVQFVAIYGLYFADEYRKNYFNYRGLPVGFNDPPRPKTN